MSPKTKKILSTFGVTAGVALLGILNAYVLKLPAEVQAGAFAIIAGAVHGLNAWGTQQGIDAQVTDKVTAAISKEAT